MLSLWVVVFSYFLGGLTFIPLCLLCVFYLTTRPKHKSEGEIGSEKNCYEELVAVDALDPEFKVGDLEELKGVEAFKKGWVYVTNKYYYHSSELQGTLGPERDTLPSRDKLKRKKKFYAILKHGNLFLYKNDVHGTDVFQVVVLKNSFVTIWPRDTSVEIPDASLFTNKTCISICRNGKAYLDDNGKLQFSDSIMHGPADQYFVYVDSNVEKEDWYFALINASKISVSDSLLDPSLSATTAHIRTRDMMYLIQTVNATEGQVATKWFNTLICRLFLSLQQTEMLNDLLKEKIHKKLTKINKPGFLDDFKIEHLDVGNSAPMITNPKLLELSPEGNTKVRCNLLYRGNLTLIISTKVNINLGSRFKNREVTIELAITIREVEGPLIILIKPPPSNRFWYAFESEPNLNIDIEPIVSTRQLSYNMITNVIKSKFKEALKESLVLPFMDDIVFYPTQNEVYRGGIWQHDNNKELEDMQTPELAEDPVSTIPSNAVSNKTDYSSNPITNSDKSSVSSQSPERKTGVSPRPFFDEDGSTSSLRKSIDVHPSSDSDSASEKESISSLGENSLKNKTMHRVGTLKNMIKARASTDGSIRSIDSNSSLDSTGSKKYFQSGMKKIGKWYKDQVNTAREAVTESQLEVSHKFNSAPFILEPQKPGVPEMISNRRTHPRLKSQSDIKEDFSKLTSESNADMFVNRARATSFDAPKSPSLNGPYPFAPQSPITPASPVSTMSRRLSVNSQLEHNHSSDSLIADGPSNQVPEILSKVPEAKEFTKENKGSDPITSTDVATAAAIAVFPTGPSSILVNGEQVAFKSLGRRRPLPVIPTEQIDIKQIDIKRSDSLGSPELPEDVESSENPPTPI
ncbi:Nvj2p Ecym_5442 [Eremothecium cymbalariae DBVPG|uniref:SMP-LTD domain-containing protein n=1 Tax=Eremothecium cymbalariae (strain CBS 270.75 / DBVPG 7215 / KCTC 17166 / NRRL Y-17582) TaxID=931890 RepID=I6NDQ1_ERECY|nr:hypothetical protein Ecym_5442 [Eremothecium cymbalariae DBVPG\